MLSQWTLAVHDVEVDVSPLGATVGGDHGAAGIICVPAGKDRHTCT